jgi:IclR family transcriptional regulator, mhp operon transcriptional activator
MISLQIIVNRLNSICPLNGQSVRIRQMARHTKKNKPQVLVRGLQRGLQVLRVLNTKSHASALEISRTTGLPRTTVYRLLDTLIEAGYVKIGNRPEEYCLAVGVCTLSDGYKEKAWLSGIAEPVITALGNDIVWPVDIATFDVDAMTIRYTTHSYSPLSLEQGVPGMRVPVLSTAIGRAYLAFCPEAERQLIIENLASGSTPDSELARDATAVKKIIAKVQRLGYGYRIGGILPKIGSIAVPVRQHIQVRASINMHFILSAISLDEAVKRYLQPLRQAAGKIETELSSAAKTIGLS